MFKISGIFYALCLTVCLTSGKELPSNFERCTRSNPDFDKCLVDAVNKALVLLKDGNKEFSIPPLEPLTIKHFEIETGGRSAITVKQSFKNAKVYNLIGSSRVLKYKTDLNNHLIVCDSLSEKLNLIGNYEMNGRILLFPIRGHGIANLTLINVHIQHRLIGEPVEKEGVKYIVLKDYKVSFKPERVYMNFDNLFGDKALSDNMNRFINENWEQVFSELKDGYAESFGIIFKEITNRIFSKVPMDEIFLP